MNNVRIMYLRSVSGTPVGCVAMRLDRKRNEVEFAVSSLNPRDNFERSVGRQLAIGRLAEHPMRVPVPPCASAHAVTRAVVAVVANMSSVSSRVRAGARRWMNTKRESSTSTVVSETSLTPELY
jgi:hypothetical protein